MSEIDPNGTLPAEIVEELDPQVAERVQSLLARWAVQTSQDFPMNVTQEPSTVK